MAARAVIHINNEVTHAYLLTSADELAFWARIIATDTKVRNAETLLEQSHKLQHSYNFY